MMRLVPLLIVLLAAVVFGVLLLRPEAPVAPSRVGQKIVSEQLPQGHAIVVNVFASWCVPCGAEMEILQEVKDIDLIGVAYKDQPQAAAAFLEKFANPYQAVLMDNGPIATALAITGVPETFLLDRDGVIRWHYAGALSETQLAELKAAVTQWR